MIDRPSISYVYESISLYFRLVNTMSTTISTEMLTITAKRTLGPYMEGIVERMCKTAAQGVSISPEDTKDLGELITKHLGLPTNVVVVRENIPNASMYHVSIRGHNGIDYFGKDQKPMQLETADLGIGHTLLNIDLDTGKITGKLVEKLECTLYITYGMLTPEWEMTVREITGVLAHEVGHAYDAIATMGDYVWLNYYLQEGVEVVLGRKPNRFKVEFLSVDALRKQVENPAEARRLMNEPTEENVRRAIITSHRNRPRPFLHSKEVNLSKKRNEQLADLFASRLGYARDLVTGNMKLDKKMHARETWSSSSFWTVEAIKIATAVAGIGLMPVFGPWSILFWVANMGLAQNEPETYDNPPERAAKVRRDLINQLKAFDKDPIMRGKLVEDIRVIDEVVKDYNNHQTVWSMISHLFSGQSRRAAQLQAREEQLERLFSNDLFLASEKLSTLK